MGRGGRKGGRGIKLVEGKRGKGGERARESSSLDLVVLVGEGGEDKEARRDEFQFQVKEASN